MLKTESASRRTLLTHEDDMNITNTLRKNIGTIIAILGFVLLCIMTFGDLGELASEAYWRNVK